MKKSFYILFTVVLLCSCAEIEYFTNKALWISDIEAGDPDEIKSQIDFSKIEIYVDDIPSDKEEEIQVLADYIADSCSNDAEKAYASFYWVAKNIEYDVKKMGKKYRMALLHGQLANPVFKKEKGVCEGYSNLYAKLAIKTGIEEAIRIDGTGINEPHAWNAILIDEKWYLCDPTWASGHLDENDEFCFQFDRSWFCVHPDTMISSHYPAYKKWQLLKEPINSDEWEDQDHVIFPTQNIQTSNKSTSLKKKYLLDGFFEN